MGDFITLKNAVAKQLEAMSKESNLFVVEVDKNLLWDTYLNSFPEGTNPAYIERTEHDCNCCKQFIRSVGNVVAIKGKNIITPWDIKEVGNFYDDVAKGLSKYVKKHVIDTIFLSDQPQAGQDYNHQLSEGGETIKWNHFYWKIPNKFKVTDGTIDQKRGRFREDKGVLQRSLKEITLDAIDIVVDLIQQGSLYRGEEHLKAVKELRKHSVAYSKFKTAKEKDLYCTLKAAEMGPTGRFRNTVIGTLLCDISDGVDLDKAVASFEQKVAPANYKRSSAPVTKGMIKTAQDKVKGLGLEEALARRHARVDDISITDILFADRSVKKSMDVFDDLMAKAPVKNQTFNKVDEVSVEDFIKNILPKAESLELMVENNHVGNLFSLIAPQNAEAGNMLLWDNNFSWSYNGEVTDSMRDRVKAHGGNVEGDLRFSIEWNEDGNNESDLDAHCREPKGGAHIYYGNARRRHPSSGMLDVDIQNPDGKVAVENIIYTNKSQMREGIYKFQVHNFSASRNNSGFKAEIEFNGQVFQFDHPKPIPNNRTVTVAEVKFDKKKGEFSIVSSLDGKTKGAGKEVWGITTNTFQKVGMVMLSPNHWGEQEKGNKHYFFIMKDCKNPEDTRGFYSEFLRSDLVPHRKVFELLGSKMRVDPCDEQLSGVGFSSTQRNSIVCKVSGSFSRMIKINF